MNNMRSSYQRIKRKAIESETGRYTFTVLDKQQLLYMFSYAVGPNARSEHYEIFYDPKKHTGAPTVEVFLTTRIKLDDVPELNSDIVGRIKKYDTIGDDEREKNAERTFDEKFYDYHLEFIPESWMARFFPMIYPYTLNP